MKNFLEIDEVKYIDSKELTKDNGKRGSELNNKN
jgi:hypothetical protein